MSDYEIHPDELMELRAEIERLEKVLRRGGPHTIGDVLAAEIARMKAEAENARLRALVKDLADDLESELNGRYLRMGTSGTVHPAEKHRYERDMANVYEARKALEEK